MPKTAHHRRYLLLGVGVLKCLHPYQMMEEEVIRQGICKCVGLPKERQDLGEASAEGGLRDFV